MSAAADSAGPLPLWRAYRALCALPCDTQDSIDAVCAATAVIEAAIEKARPVTIEDLAAQVLIATRDGDCGLSPAVLHRLHVLVDTA